jgi:GNAT superfamily N-acetyltransferase
MSEPWIRPVREEELSALAESLAPLELFVRYGLNAKALVARWREGLAQGGQEILTALVDEKPRAVCWFFPRGTFGSGAYLRTLAVADGLRGQGLGAKLLAEYEARVGRPRGGYFLLAADFNEGAHRFYTRHGYREVGALPGFAAPGVTERIFWKKP